VKVDGAARVTACTAFQLSSESNVQSAVSPACGAPPDAGAGVAAGVEAATGPDAEVGGGGTGFAVRLGRTGFSGWGFAVSG
jgi:hypothetical protein